ncbi:MAG: hypothetical protein NZ553_01720 [Caldilinea sp.]|nr:hypothetical protein [Caldilinea sp.]MDW8439169.1 hypothetical protein [Caldilineaceae bacterium]
MSDYLANLVARSFTRAETIQPRLPSRFEPVTSGAMVDAAPAMDMTIAQEGAEERSAPAYRGLQVVEDVRSIAPAAAQRTPHLDEATDVQPKSARGQRLSPLDAQVPSTAATPASEGAETGANAHNEQPSLPSRPPIQVAVVARDHSFAVQESKRAARRVAASHQPGAIRPDTEGAFSAESQAEATDSNDRQTSHATPKRDVIQVTIGRIEVRAVTPAPQAKPQAAPRSGTLSLMDYLNGRTGNRTGGGR